MEHTHPEARTRVRERRGPETRSQVVRRSVESRNLGEIKTFVSLF